MGQGARWLGSPPTASQPPTSRGERKAFPSSPLTRTPTPGPRCGSPSLEETLAPWANGLVQGSSGAGRATSGAQAHPALGARSACGTSPPPPMALPSRLQGEGENLPASHCQSSLIHTDHGFPSKMTSPGCLNGNGEERCPFAPQAVGALDSGPSRDAFGLQLPAAGSVLFPGPSPFPGREKLTFSHGGHQDAVQPLLGRALQAPLSHRLKSPQSRRAPLVLRTACASRFCANRRPSCRSLVPSPRFLSLDAKQGGLTVPNSVSTQGTVQKVETKTSDQNYMND